MRSCCFLLAAACAASAAEPSLLMLSASEAEQIRSAVREKAPWTVASAARLRRDADRQLMLGPWSVTHARPKGLQIDAHDYYSEGPYWWPDPANPQGPYIRKDGRTNPDRFMENKSALNAMCEAVFTLGTAAYVLDDPRYAARAQRVIAVWFVDPATRMNPHLEYGQAVRGINEGRAAGIIDTRWLIRAAQGIALLDRTGRLDRATLDGVRQWYAGYLKWLTTSPKGLSEKKSGNNHASWWTAQVSACAAIAGDDTAQAAAFDWYRQSIFPKQIKPNGPAPREESRTKSLGYSTFNLEAYTVVCRIAERRGVDLWHVRSAEGATLETVVGYLLPAVRNPRAWKLEQIVTFDNDSMYYLAFAGMGWNRPEWTKVYREFERPTGAWLALVDLLVDGAASLRYGR